MQQMGQALRRIEVGSFFDDELTGSQYTGVQGKLSLWLKTDQSGVVVYPRCDGAGVTGLSVDVASDNRWHLYEIPFVMCGTSNGYQVEATALITGNIYADDIFLGASDPTTNIGIDTPWTAYTPTHTGLGTVTSNIAHYRRVGSSLEVYGTVDSGTVTATPWTISLPSGLSLDTSKLTADRDERVGEATQSGTAGALALSAAGVQLEIYYVSATTTTAVYVTDQVNGGGGR